MQSAKKRIITFSTCLLLLGLCIVLVLLSPSMAFSQIKHTENTLKFSEGHKPERVTISDMGFMIGSWTGNAFGGVAEETWSKPAGGAMMGTFRLVKNGKPIIYEFFTLTEVDGSLLIKLKHFNSDMTGWEEKDKTVNFRFIKKEGTRVYFEGLTFEAADKKHVNIYLVIHEGGNVREELLRLSKVE